MKDNIENFIRDNRDAFDHREPRSDVWESISRKLPGRPSGIHWMWKAAAVIFFMSTAVLLVQKFEKNDVPALAEQREMSSEFNQVEQFYFEQISEKKNLIDELQKDNIPEIDVLAELQKLDAMYLVLRQQYDTEPTAEVIDALTLNLLVRIDLLNKTLEDLDKPKLPGKSGDVQI